MITLILCLCFGSGRGICFSDTHERNRIGSVIRNIARGESSVCSQGLHGVGVGILMLFQGWLPGLHFAISASGVTLLGCASNAFSACGGGVQIQWQL